MGRPQTHGKVVRAAQQVATVVAPADRGHAAFVSTGVHMHRSAATRRVQTSAPYHLHLWRSVLMGQSAVLQTAVIICCA